MDVRIYDYVDAGHPILVGCGIGASVDTKRRICNWKVERVGYPHRTDSIFLAE